jgi:hypothetical protein
MDDAPPSWTLRVRLWAATFPRAAAYFVAFQLLDSDGGRGGRRLRKRTEISSPSATPSFKRSSVSFELSSGDLQRAADAAASGESLHLQIGAFAVEEGAAATSEGVLVGSCGVDVAALLRAEQLRPK